MRARALPVVAAVLATGASGCESTQTQSARLERESRATLLDQQGVRVEGRSDSDVRIGRPVVLSDENGTAVVVELRARGDRPLGPVPLSVQLEDRSGTVVGDNAAPGLDAALTAVAVLPANRPVMWVNDQLQVTGRPARATVKAGPAPVLRGTAPRLTVRSDGLESDPTSGVSAVGSVTNGSGEDQRDLVVTAVARRDGRVVAAGRGLIPRVRAGRTVDYSAFFIGDPRSAQLAVSVQPSAVK